MNRIKFVFILFLITLTSLLTSCFNNDASKVKIVDMQGNSAKINKIVPQFNQEQLENQKIAFKNKEDSENLEVNRFRQDYNDVKANNNSNNLKNTRQINKNTDLNIDTSANNDSLMFPISNTNKYPNDIFADRITNYNYIQETPKQNNNYRNDKIDNRNLTYKNEIIEGDIVDNKKVETNKKITTTESSKPTKKVEIKKTAPSKRGVNINEYYIQIGIYSEKRNADIAYNKYNKIGKCTIENYTSTKNNTKKYKVMLGPYSNKTAAESDLQKVIKTGHYDVYITEKK